MREMLNDRIPVELREVFKDISLFDISVVIAGNPIMTVPKVPFDEVVANICMMVPSYREYAAECQPSTNYLEIIFTGTDRYIQIRACEGKRT